ncbi:MAG: hypothetical protein M3P38_12025 [Chloroflexota bacterium]|nr:hypothetical protein [Chloroflexota bacterium]
MRSAVAAVITVTITACSSSGPPAATLAAPTTPTAASPAATSAPTSGAATPTVRPSPTPVTDASQAFRALTSGWRPSGLSLVIATSSGSGDTTLVALPVGPSGRAGAPTPIVSFGPGPWSLRPDGGAVAVGVWTGRSSRIVIWDVLSGAARWLTSDEPGTNAFSPIWSRDGTSLYYSSSSDDGKSSGLFEIGADGSGKKQIKMADERNGPPEGLTPDGKGLVWSRGQAGGSVEILDVATGINRHLEDVARVVSWRSQQPRVLLMVGGCCAGRPGGSLVAWDDVALTSRVVAELGQNGDPAWGGGSWDPMGTRIAAVRFDNASPYEGTLVILDPTTGATQPIAGTQGAGSIQWLAEGIVFALSHVRQPAAELMLLPSGGGAAVSLYKTDGLQGITVVRP